MRIVRLLHAKRMLFCLCLLGMPAWAGGCDSGSVPVSDPDTIKANTQKIQDARIKEYGASARPKSEPAKKR
jgi:hypothetical protein